VSREFEVWVDVFRFSEVDERRNVVPAGCRDDECYAAERDEKVVVA